MDDAARPVVTSTAPNYGHMKFINVTKRLGHVMALRDVTLIVGRGEYVAVLDPEGIAGPCFLGLAAGWLEPDHGMVLIDGVPGRLLGPAARRAAVISRGQDVMEEMTVWQNIAMDCVSLGFPEPVTTQRVRYAADLLRLKKDLAEPGCKLPAAKRIRTLLARPVALGCDLLLLDGLTRGTDRRVRAKVSRSIKRLRRRGGITVIYVGTIWEEIPECPSRVVLVDGGVFRILDTSQSPGGIRQVSVEMFGEDVQSTDGGG